MCGGTVRVSWIKFGGQSLFLSAGKRWKCWRGSTPDAKRKNNLLAIGDTSGQHPECTDEVWKSCLQSSPAVEMATTSALKGREK